MLRIEGSFDLKVKSEPKAKCHLVGATGGEGDQRFAAQKCPVVEVGLEARSHERVGPDRRGAPINSPLESCTHNQREDQ
jgi:hypothetical protein